jgi:hypothetical protein
VGSLVSVDGVTAPADVEVMRDVAVDVLCDPSLSHIVDFVTYADGDAVVVANTDGAARLSRSELEAPAEVIRGRNPVELQDPLAFSSLAGPPRGSRHCSPHRPRRMSRSCTPAVTTGRTRAATSASMAR